MDDVWVRAGLVIGALALAVAIGLWQRRAVRGPERVISETRLDPGLYLFTSQACPTCAAARSTLEESVGLDGFSEFVWEAEPGRFAALGISAVPAVLLVAEGGDGRLYPGQPRAVLHRV